MRRKARSAAVHPAIPKPHGTHSRAHGKPRIPQGALPPRVARSPSAADPQTAASAFPSDYNSSCPSFHPLNSSTLKLLNSQTPPLATNGANSTRKFSYARNSSDFSALSEQDKIFAI